VEAFLKESIDITQKKSNMMKEKGVGIPFTHSLDY
jgi:hypothetical protein